MGRIRTNNPENLPPNLHKKSGSYYAVTNGLSRKWIYLSKNKNTAIAMHSNLFSNDSSFKKEKFEQGECVVMYEGRLVGIKSFYVSEMIKTLYRRSKAGAKARGIDYALTLDDIELMYARSKGSCELTGVPFLMRSESNDWKSNPWVPSIDRINSGDGYHPENCRILCNAVNRALGEWGENVFSAICSGYSAKELCRKK
jgi:hypothetical protein